MLAIPRRIRSVHHPLIDEIYIKKEPQETVLVIETQPSFAVQYASEEKSNPYINELLTDLASLEAQVKSKGEDFDRVDIRTAVCNRVEVPYAATA